LFGHCEGKRFKIFYHGLFSPFPVVSIHTEYFLPSVGEDIVHALKEECLYIFVFDTNLILWTAKRKERERWN